MMSPKSTPPAAPLTLPEKLAEMREQAAKWNQVAAHPSLSPASAAWARDAARSAAAAARLYQGALDWQLSQQSSADLRRCPMNARPPSSPKSIQPASPLSIPEKLAWARAEQAKWNRIAASPNLSAEAAVWAKDNARSYAAAASLYQGALDWEAAGRPPPKSESDPDSEIGSETGYGLLVRLLHR